MQYKRRRKYKYNLHSVCEWDTGITPTNPINRPYIKLTTTGKLTIKEGYAWDGASGCPDLNSVIRASLVHDALYQLMREGDLSRDFRMQSDKVFRDLAIADGLSPLLAKFACWALRLFGARHAKSKMRYAPN